GERVSNLNAAAAIVGIQKRKILTGKDVAGVYDTESREKNPCVTIGVPPPEIEQINPVVGLADRHLVFEGALRHPDAVVFLENIGGWPLLCETRGSPHLLHVLFGVLVRDHFDCCRELHIAADMVSMSMSVDDRRYRLRCEGFDLLQNRLSPPRIFSVHNDNDVGSNKNSGVPTPAFQHIQVVLEFFDIDILSLLLPSAATSGRLLIGRNCP